MFDDKSHEDETIFSVTQTPSLTITCPTCMAENEHNKPSTIHFDDIYAHGLTTLAHKRYVCDTTDGGKTLHELEYTDLELYTNMHVKDPTPQQVDGLYRAWVQLGQFMNSRPGRKLGNLLTPVNNTRYDWDTKNQNPTFTEYWAAYIVLNKISRTNYKKGNPPTNPETGLPNVTVQEFLDTYAGYLPHHADFTQALGYTSRDVRTHPQGYRVAPNAMILVPNWRIGDYFVYTHLPATLITTKK